MLHLPRMCGRSGAGVPLLRSPDCPCPHSHLLIEQPQSSWAKASSACTQSTAQKRLQCLLSFILSQQLSTEVLQPKKRLHILMRHFLVQVKTQTCHTQAQQSFFQITSIRDAMFTLRLHNSCERLDQQSATFCLLQRTTMHRSITQVLISL